MKILRKRTGYSVTIVKSGAMKIVQTMLVLAIFYVTFARLLSDILLFLDLLTYSLVCFVMLVFVVDIFWFDCAFFGHLLCVFQGWVFLCLLELHFFLEKEIALFRNAKFGSLTEIYFEWPCTKIWSQINIRLYHSRNLFHFTHSLLLP